MDLVSGYDSDDESQSGSPPKVESKPTIEVNTTKPIEKSVNGKKVKKIDMSILPTHIVEALMRGDTAVDSDEELESNRKQKQASNKTVTNSECELLKMLPNPKQNKVQNAGNNLSVPGKSVEKEKTKTFEQKNAPVTKLSKMAEARIKADLNKSLGSLKSMVTKKYSEDAPTDTFAQNQSEVYYQGNVNDNNKESSNTNNTHNNSQEDQNSTMESNIRKRKREIELQLLRGDLTGIENTASVQDIKVDHTWDKRSYEDKQKREQMIRQGSAGGKLGLPPNKVQNRKHQLSSLAAKAVDTELALMEARGSRMKTKSETQGKYGW